MALSVCEYGVPTVPADSEGDFTETGALPIVAEYAAEEVSPELSLT